MKTLKLNFKLNEKYFEINTPFDEAYYYENLLKRLSFIAPSRLYKTKCKMSSKELISIYEDVGEFPIISKDIWWGDFDNTENGLDYSNSKVFFDQYKDLKKELVCLTYHK